MIKIENVVLPHGVWWERVIMGARNPKNSWHLSDSHMCGSGTCDICVDFDNCPYDHDPDRLIVGPKDLDLLMRLSKGGPVHAKYRRHIPLMLEITAPIYWWKEFDQYKMGVYPNPAEIDTNSCSTMHKIHDKEFTLDDFSHERLGESSKELLETVIQTLNYFRNAHNRATLPDYKTVCFHQMIQLLPSSYNQKRTVMLNYEVLANMYESRKAHKLHEWRELCKWIESLPYSEIITGKVEVEG